MGEAETVNWTSKGKADKNVGKKNLREGGEEMSICDFFFFFFLRQADGLSRAVEECGCAPCQLAAARCGKSVDP